MAARRNEGDGMGDRRRGVFMISVAAELAGMHPQTLRMYETRGLITPKRSPKNTRLYSQRDVERLQRIQELTTGMGMNLAGVERVFELEDALEAMRIKMERLSLEAQEMERQMQAALERLERGNRYEIVPYEAGEIVRASDARPLRGMRIPIRRSSHAG